MVSDIILEIDSVSKSFIITHNSSITDNHLLVLDSLDLIVECGKITALIGSNGAGKTTLFNIVSRLIDAEKGSITLYSESQEYNLFKYKPHQLASLGIGRLFQSSHIFEQMSIIDNLLIGYQYGSAEFPYANLYIPGKSREIDGRAKAKALEILKTIFGTDHYFWKQRNQVAGRLSYGQKRLLETARLMMGNYKLMLLDEPTAGISPPFRIEIGRLLEKMVHEMGVSVLLIEHNMHFVREHADICHFMHNGRDHVFGTPADVLGNEEVRRMYLGA
ncbi:MAG: ATP-binding cassette domain-containing protein [Kiritimatiellae bacterium]|nr:ATP-binding cassette domain-containing protein [Kiritimatiellia bacterium]